jgi:hypothetical protein
MSISLTRILQQITGLNTFFAGPSASRDNGVVLLDTATVTWGTDGQGNIQATAAGGATFPTATAAGQVLTSTAAGTNYTAQTPIVPALQLIQEQTLASPAASITFSGIPGTFTNLKLIASLINAANNQNVSVAFNGDDTAGHYASTLTVNTNGTVGGSSIGGSNGAVLFLSGQTVVAANECTILLYTSAGFKNVVGSSFNPANSVAQTSGGIYNQAGAVTSITLVNGDASNFAAGTVVSLYGIQ